MKKTLLGWLLLVLPSLLLAQTAQVQVIHNSPDVAADTVDVYLNGVRQLDDVPFRTASPFLNVTAGVPIQVDIAPGNSTSVANSVYTNTISFVSGSTYILVADGILSSTGYNPGNVGASAFDIQVYNMGQTTAGMMTNTDVLVHHGVTDAPAVDVVEVSVPAGTIVTNASYTDFAGYLNLATADYRLEVRPTGAATAVGSYEAPLSTLGLAGDAIVVVASGFLDPSQNNNGPAFGLWAALPTGGPLVELPPSTSRAQVIHNCADVAAQQVDVYLDGNLLLDDFTFRTATPFVDLPAGVPIQVDIAPSNSTSVASSIATFNYNLDADRTYVLVADGIVSGSGYTPGNVGASAFDIKVYDMGQEAAGMMTNTDVLVHHGSTDAPAVDVVEVAVPAGAIVTNASYGDFAGYLNLNTADYRLEVRATGATTAVASFEAPLATLNLQGGAAVVVASGFLDPTVNSNGPAFGLWVALPTGGALVALPPTTARAQVIHNSADAVAQQVDIYLNGDLLLDDFAFRTATPFVDLPAGAPIQIDVAPGNSTSVANSIATFNYTLDPERTYVLVADGIVSAAGYNPGNMGASAFDLKVYDMGQEAAGMMTNTDVLVHHGATDAPAVDVVEVAVPAGAIVTNASYGDFAGYLNLNTADYRLEVRATGAATAVASFEAPLATLNLQGAAAVVVASGFLDPSVNSNGPDFGLWVALPAGGALVELPATTARAQVIHNSADIGAQQVDVYLDGDLLLDDFAFRTATSFVDLPAGAPIQIDVAPGNSTSVANSIATFNYTLDPERTYILVADGIVSASGYNPGNVGASAFDLKVYDMGQEAAGMMTNTDVLVHHGATDAPAVDVVETSVPAGTLVTNASYGDFAGYLNLNTADYRLEVQANSNSSVVGAFDAPLASLSLQGAAVVVLASGFLDPSQNSGGPDFGLWVAAPAGGTLTPLTNVINVTRINGIEGVSMDVLANPVVTGTLALQIEAEATTTAVVEVLNILGQPVMTGINAPLAAGSSVERLDISKLPSGTYWVRMTANQQQLSVPFVVAQ